MNNRNISQSRALLSIVSKWHSRNGAKLAEALLERLYQEQLVRGKGNVMVDSEMYNICMNAWNKSGVDGERIVRNVESIVRRMEERFFREGDDDDSFRYEARPDRISYNCLINAYCKWAEDSSDKVEAVLEKMNALADDAPSSDGGPDEEYASLIRPDAFTYKSLMNYYATRGKGHSSAQRAEDLLFKMSELSRQDDSMSLDVTSFNIVLKAWGNCGAGIKGAQHAEALLRMMIKLNGEGLENLKPDIISFSTVISAYSKVDTEDASSAVDRVMGILDEFEGSYFPDSHNINSCYNAAANAIVKGGLRDAAGKVKELMVRMKNMDASPGPNMIISLIEAYGIEGSDESFRRGKELLSDMIDGKLEVMLETDPVVPFNILLNSILKADSARKLERAEALMRMEDVDGNTVPDLSSFGMMISALSRSPTKDSEQRAVKCLRRMLKLYSGGCGKLRPNSFLFKCVISMLAKSKQQIWANDVIYKTLMAMENQQRRGNASVIPDTITYNSVIGKLSQTATKENAKKVMKLLTTMEGNPTFAPDMITYTNVLILQEKLRSDRVPSIASSCLERAMSKDEKIQFPVDRLGLQVVLLALSKSHELKHAILARRAWEWMEDSSGGATGDMLNSGLCNLVLIAYSKTNDEGAAGEMLSFLSERIGRYNAGDRSTILPTVVGFSSALTSLSKAGRIDDALRLLEVMKVLSRDGELPDVKPDDSCYASILGPLVRSQAENAASQAQKIVRLMKEDLGRIQTASLNAAMNVCSKTRSPSAVEAAFEILELGRTSESCDAITFGLMIRTCMSMQGSDDKRFKLVKSLFKLCAKSGLVGNMVMRELKHFKNRLIMSGQLPMEWTINAKDK